MRGISISSIALSLTRVTSVLGAVVDGLVGLFIPLGSDALITADGKTFLVAES